MKHKNIFNVTKKELNSNKKYLLFFIYFSLLPTLMFFFTSCDVYSENNLFAELSTRCVDQENCVQESSEYMELKINTENNYPVAQGVSEFDVGGECNEGGFVQHRIVWELFLDNNLVGSKDSTLTMCVNGRFSMRVTLPQGRQGLMDPSRNVRREYRLDVELIGMTQAGEIIKNSLMARKSITLTPL